MLAEKRSRAVGVAIVVCLLMSLIGVRSAAADGADFDDGYVGPDNAELGHIGVEFRQQDADDQVFSWVGTEEGGFAACADVRGDCNRVRGEIEFTAILPPCESASDNYCIVEVASIDASGNEVKGVFDSYFPDRGYNDFVGDESIGIPSGGPASLWAFPGISHYGGEKFFVRVGISGKKQQSKYVTQTFQAGITPVSPIQQWLCTEDPQTRRSIETGSLCSPRISYLDEPDDGRLRGRFGIGGGSGTFSTTGSDCVMRGNYRGEGICMNRRAFQNEMRFRLVVRLGEYPKGWLHGRIANPEISFTDLTGQSKGVQISVTGSTLSLPVVAAGSMFSDLPGRLSSAYKNANKWQGFNGRGGCCAMSRAYGENWQNDLSQFNYHSSPSAWSDHGIDELNAWLPFIGDKATANLSTWSVRTLSSDEMSGADTCLKDEKKIAGIVTTNATQYSPGPPKFIKSTGTLDYQVAAPHYRSGGGTFLGTYNLIMRSELARCLYGFSNAPLNASISVVDDQGVTTVGTKNVSEKDGWIKIAAYGFGFSSPTIKVKFVSGKSKSIVCVKGKTVRTVTGAKPVCPKGFKVKK